MDINTIAKNVNVNQEHSMDRKMIDRLINKFTDELIREYGEFNSDHYLLSISDIPQSVQKVFLNIIDASLFEDYPSTDEGIVSALKDNKKIMQYYINLRLDDVFQEDIAEMDFYLSRRSNGDVYLQKRY